jgi:hypothetical protein
VQVFHSIACCFPFLTRPVETQELKAIVPSPILKACLDDMALDSSGGTVFADSDEEDEEKKTGPKPSEKTTPYAGSLCFKGGRTANASLYYVDFKKRENNGNGLEGEEKNKLYSDLAVSHAEKQFLELSIQTEKSTASKLLSEPTNEEATAKLETEEATFAELQRNVESARELKVHEKTKNQLKRRIEHMSTEWRKRRRICREFLNNMEEITEGVISAKKCLSGDGQIEIDSDEAIIKTAKAFANKKKERLTKRRTSDLVPQASESFVAVQLDSQGRVFRVYSNDDENM